MMNFRDKKSKRVFATVVVVLICAGMLIGLLTGLLGVFAG